MTKNAPGKTRTFIKYGLIFWLATMGLFGLLKWLINRFGDFTNEHDGSGFLDELSGIIFVFGICGIPLILGLSVVLKLAERIIDRIGD